MIAAGIAFAPIIVPILAVVAAIYGITYAFAKWKFNRWSRVCLKKYLTHQQDQPIKPAQARQSSSPRSKKVEYCIGVIEQEIIKHPLFFEEEPAVSSLCGKLLNMALGDERIAVRLIRREWKNSPDIIECLNRAIDLWEKDHNRFC